MSSIVATVIETRRTHSTWHAVVVACLLSSGCAAPTPEAVGPPPIPARAGPLRVDVVYPPNRSLISARDSNFIFGSVGDGSASLTINGHPVAVQPNGAFLAYLPVSTGPGDTTAEYELVASLGEQEARVVHRVRLLPPPTATPSDTIVIESSSLWPRGSWWVREGEDVPVQVRASPGAQVRLLLPGADTVRLMEVGAGGPSAANWIFGAVPAGSAAAAPGGLYRGRFPAYGTLGRGRSGPTLSPVTPDLSRLPPLCVPPSEEATRIEAASDASAAADAPPVEGERPFIAKLDSVTAAAVENEATRRDSLVEANCAILEVVRAGAAARTPLPLDLWLLSETGPVVELREQPAGFGQDGFVVGRAAPGATTLWMWRDGVRARVTGRRNGSVRLALDQLTEAWVALSEVVWLPGVTLAKRASVGTVRLAGGADRVTVRIALSHPVPYHVETADRRLTLILYGAYSNTDWLRYGREDPFVRAVRWEQVMSDRYLLHFDLAAAPWGYRVKHGAGGLTLEIRKPPPIDRRRPFEGLDIVLDPGHPPGGATGPTRLTEADANLAVAFKLKRLLEDEGAEVVLARADRSAVRIYDRTALAEALDADILISIHNNALPDGVNPFENHGTSVYYFHPHALDLARALQRGLLSSMGLPDLGFGRASLALARPAWVMAALTEGAFMMIPEQEAGLRSTAFQEAYAKGVRDGILRFLLERAE